MLRPSNGRIWEVQVRDYVENISLGLPNARLLKQHSLTIVDDDESSWTKLHFRPISITLIEGEADNYYYNADTRDENAK